jgi:quinolinate synthase
MAAEVRALAEERNAVILAHNYQVPEVQDVATSWVTRSGCRAGGRDGRRRDRLLRRALHGRDGVDPLAHKTVLLPDLDAGCSLADSITADQLRAWKAEHPGAIVVMYVNTTPR